MKSEFNKLWNSSKQPRKQVKFRANAPNHIKKKFIASPLEKSLREKYGRKTVRIRKGDTVKVMRGKFKGKQGKVGDVDVKNTRIQIDGIQRSKGSGEKMITWFHPSKVRVVALYLEDSKRMKRNKKVGEKKSEVVAKVEKSSEKIKDDTKKVEVKNSPVAHKDVSSKKKPSGTSLSSNKKTEGSKK